MTQRPLHEVQSTRDKAQGTRHGAR